MKLKVMTIVGTRPELIKLSRVISELDKYTEHTLVHTGQNYDYELNQIFFDELEIRAPDAYLDVADPNVAITIANVITKVDAAVERLKPDAVLFYGDTNSCLGVIACKRRHIPIFHMEAGNRCFDMRVPEEMNRRVVDHLSDINMTLTEHARRYLIAEGIRPETVIKVGSSMREVLAHHADGIARSNVIERLGLVEGEYIVVSAHREENVDVPENVSALLDSLAALRHKFGHRIIVSVHPRTRKRLEQFPGKTEIPGVEYLKPLGFLDYVRLQERSFCVVSDSGTLTEEASMLRFPAVAIRNTHERPEGSDAGVLIMSGLSAHRVTDAVDVVTSQPRGPSGAIADYAESAVSEKVVRIILSYTDYVNRTVWKKPT